MTLFKEIEFAFQMLAFAKKNPSAFTGQRFEYAMLVSFYKLLGGLACFGTNIVIMLRSSSIEDVIKDFVAVEIIANIDDFMYGTVSTNIDRKLYIQHSRALTDDWSLMQDYVFDQKSIDMEQSLRKM